MGRSIAVSPMAKRESWFGVIWLWMGGEEIDLRFKIRSFDSPAARSG